MDSFIDMKRESVVIARDQLIAEYEVKNDFARVEELRNLKLFEVQDE